MPIPGKRAPDRRRRAAPGCWARLFERRAERRVRRGSTGFVRTSLVLGVSGVLLRVLWRTAERVSPETAWIPFVAACVVLLVIIFVHLQHRARLDTIALMAEAAKGGAAITSAVGSGPFGAIGSLGFSAAPASPTNVASELPPEGER